MRLIHLWSLQRQQLLVPLNREMLSESKSSTKVKQISASRVQIYKDQLIGSGNFAEVFKGVYRKSSTTNVRNKTEVAVKVSRALTHPAADKDADPLKSPMYIEMYNEALIMSTLRHRHIIEFLGISDDKFPSIIMEFCAGGSLDVHLKNSKRIGVVDRVQFAYEISAGMRYLEKQGCVHRDLATRNVLISSNGVLKVSDFGLSKSQHVTETKDTGRTQIPIRWLAPESLVKNAVFNSKTDVWSFGVTIYEIFNEGQKPWSEKNVKWIATQIRRIHMPTLPASMPAVFKEYLTQKCWVKDPKDRWDFERVNAMINFWQLTLFQPHKAQFYSLHRPKRGVTVSDDYADEKLDVEVLGVEFAEFEALQKSRVSKAGVCMCKSIAEIEAKNSKAPLTPVTKVSVRRRKTAHTEREDYKQMQSIVSRQQTVTNTATTTTEGSKERTKSTNS